MESNQIKIGLTNNSQCSYLPAQQERVAVIIEAEHHTPEHYEIFLANGFRRSGDTIYKPHCDHCQACQPIRVAIPDITFSKSQKRLLNKAHHLRWEFKEELDSDWFELYERYISIRHSNGSMFPANRDTFYQFINTTWLKPQFLHLYDNNKLIAIAVTDCMEQCLSAFYTFFEPEYALSLGTLCVLLQMKQSQNMGKQWLYLGYQIDDCPAMNYKVRFQHHQKLVNQRWQG
ncbi:arginyltransferase [Vibrio rumoiensis]|uniref:Aspartate/glutamate leucyltransferase n=1 Tax=Vibrio rumoiensis 1S-45 TaxID=1188252 RepID=A0A1E5E201_9VIBR|nr:arginyltransferase [Vibrio rumoiensis]OEF25359.1 arginyltransferase [Vibrio rumoiensis 1S-45]